VKGLNRELNSFEAGVRTLGIENLSEEGFSREVVWMTCERAELTGGHPAALRFLANCQNNKGWYSGTSLCPIRLKIEVECSAGFDPNEYLYIEAHFPVTSEEASEIRKGISRNLVSGELIGTERSYNPSEFLEFFQKHFEKGRKVELCLFDSNVQEDGGWIPVPNGKKKLYSFGPMSPSTMKTLHDDYTRIFRNGSKKLWEVS
jgi:hypothetical protein